MSERVPVRVLEATGQARNYLYAYWVCNGYNPLDHVFWGIMKTPPPSDQTWRLCGPWIAERCGDIMLIPKGFVD